MRDHRVSSTVSRHPQGVVLLLGLAVVLLPCIGHGDPFQRPKDPIAATPADGVKRPRIIPWIEINDPAMLMSQVNPNIAKDRANLSLLDHGLEGLALWSRVTDTVIVTTRPGQVENLYPVLMRRKPPSLRIIGGLKTFILPGCVPGGGDRRPYDFTDADTWRALATEAEKITRLTGSREVLMENETSLTLFHTGKANIDFDSLRRSLAVWRDTRVQVWWWLPYVLADSTAMPTRQETTRTLVATVASAVPDSVFLTAYAGWRDWQRYDAEVQRRRLMAETVGVQRTRDLLYVTVDGYVHFSLLNKRRCHNIPEAVQQVSELEAEAVIYPGATHWVSVAREYDQFLSSSKPPSP